MANNRNTVIDTVGAHVRLYLKNGSFNMHVLYLASVEDAETIASVWELSNPFNGDSIVDTEVNTLFGKELI